MVCLSSRTDIQTSIPNINSVLIFPSHELQVYYTYEAFVFGEERSKNHILNSQNQDRI
jgi:hypothetical protein